MKIKTFLIVFFAVSLVFISLLSSLVSGQTGPVQEAQVWRCLTSTHENAYDYTAYAEGTGFPTDRDVYLVTCVGEGNSGGYECTTGNAQYDQLLKLAGDADAIIADPPGKTRTADGKVSLYVEDISYLHTGTLTFFGVTLGVPSQEQGTGGIEGEEKSQQLGTVIIPTPTPVEDIEKCTVIGWDPFGRVFDAKSLEPLPNINITLLDSNKNKYNQPQTANPLTTVKDGAFNFLVTEGSYYLSPSVPINYTFTANPILNPNYQSAYFNIYKPNEKIDELINTREEISRKKPDPEHRDIPLDPGSNQVYESCPSMISYGVVRLNNNTRIEGKVSHPLTIVSVIQGDKELKKTQADKFGFYQLWIDNKNISADTDLIVKFTKVDLTGAGRTFPQCNITPSPEAYSKNSYMSSLIKGFVSRFFTVYAQSTIKISNPIQQPITINPILTYIEGYAYDTSGKIIPKAKIVVKMVSSNIVYYQGKADEKGFFSIDSKYLPIFPYYLEFSGVKMTTSEFVKKNNNYLIANKINLGTTIKNNQTGEKSTSSANLNIFPSTVSQTGGNLNPQKQADMTTKQNNTFSIKIVILFLVVTIIALGAMALFIFIKIKRSN